MKEDIKRLCQSGAFSLFEDVADEVEREIKEVDFDSNSHEMAYRMGKRDGAREYKSELLSRIKDYANE